MIDKLRDVDHEEIVEVSDNTLVESNKRNHLFDLIKMICILMVITTHINWSANERLCFVFPFIIEMAVPIFLIISSYLRTKKIEKVGFRRFVSFHVSLTSFLNLIVAYVFVACIEIFATLALNHFGMSINSAFLESGRTLFLWFIFGLSGPGSYYVPVMVQLIVYFPLVFLLFKKSAGTGILACFFVNIAYELVVYFVDLDLALYRLLIFRYTLIIGDRVK